MKTGEKIFWVEKSQWAGPILFGPAHWFCSPLRRGAGAKGKETVDGLEEISDLNALLLEGAADALHKGQGLGPVAVDAEGIAVDLNLFAGD